MYDLPVFLLRGTPEGLVWKRVLDILDKWDYILH